MSVSTCNETMSTVLISIVTPEVSVSTCNKTMSAVLISITQNCSGARRIELLWGPAADPPRPGRAAPAAPPPPSLWPRDPPSARQALLHGVETRTSAAVDFPPNHFWFFGFFFLERASQPSRASCIAPPAGRAAMRETEWSRTRWMFDLADI